MRRTIVVVALTITSVLIAPTGAGATGHGGSTKCKDDGHNYIHGDTATRHGKKAVLVGDYLRFHPCGEDGGYFTTTGTKSTLTLTPSSTIKVFPSQLNPSKYKTVTAAKFPHAFRRNSDEQIYQFSGPAHSIRKLTEHFVS